MGRKDLCNEKRFYVYGLYDPDKKHPFYIGKGTSDRRNYHFRETEKGRNTYKDKKIAKIKRQERKPYSKVIFDNLTEAKAYDREWGLIHMLDVHPECTLTNIDYSWGKGVASGENNVKYWKGKKRPEHSKKMTGRTRPEKVGRKISKANSGENHWNYNKSLSEEHKQKLSKAFSGEGNPWYGKERSEETKKKISEANKGKKLSKETKAKMSKNRKGGGPRTILSQKQAGEIKWLVENSDMTQLSIGNEYGVSDSTACAIKREKSWSYVEPEPPKHFEC